MSLHHAYFSYEHQHGGDPDLVRSVFLGPDQHQNPLFNLNNHQHLLTSLPNVNLIKSILSTFYVNFDNK